jgi:hypothetical protein
VRTNRRALDLFQQAISVIESVRAELELLALKREFLSDKREVYDAALVLLIERPQPPLAEIVRLMERSRARTLQDRGLKPDLKAVQAALDDGTAILEFWCGPSGGAVLYITGSAAGVIKRPAVEVQSLRRAIVERPDSDWRDSAGQLGEAPFRLGPPAETEYP